MAIYMQHSLGFTLKSFSSHCWYSNQLRMGLKDKTGLIYYLNITAGISKNASLIPALII